MEMSDITNMSEEELDQEINKLTNEIKGMGGETSSSDYPKPPTSDSIYKFFREILKLKDIRQIAKVGNLDKEELGKLKLPVRNYMDIANYADKENLDKVSSYLNGKAEIILSSSLSKKGFLPTLFVTQIKKQQSLSKGGDKKKKGWGWGKKEEEETPEQV